MTYKFQPVGWVSRTMPITSNRLHEGHQMIVKWTTQRGYAEINRQECTRETEKSVWFMRTWYAGSPPKEYKAYKIGVNIEYHDTWESAWDYLLDQAESRVIAARRNLEVCNSYYGNVKGLKKPEAACDD